MPYQFPVIITQEKDGMFTGYAPTLRGCHTQAKTLRTLNKRLQEVITLCVEVERDKKKSIPRSKFIAVQHIEVTI
jgi:predicted RNase H-like HicB family nuclease